MVSAALSPLPASGTIAGDPWSATAHIPQRDPAYADAATAGRIDDAPLIVAGTAETTLLSPESRVMSREAAAPPAGWPWAAILIALGVATLAAFAIQGFREQRRLAEALARTRREHRAAIQAIAERQNLETLGRLTASVAHDMGNVMQAVEFYLRSIPGTLDDRDACLRLIERARGAAKRGSMGARDLLALARGSAPAPVPTDLRPLLSELAEVMQELLGPSYAVQLDLPPSLPQILADPGDLEAMLINLTTNSRDAMAEAGAGTLTISAALIGETRAADMPADLPSGEWVRVAIADTGVGMDPDVLERAMEPFFTTKPRGRGTGLGLALAREFAERSGGLLRIASARGNGTLASLFLHPASDAGATSANGDPVGTSGTAGQSDGPGTMKNIHVAE